MTRRLIIGCGYVGRRVAQAWLGQGAAVFALTRSPEHARAFAEHGLRPIIGDVTDQASLAALPDVETVLYAVGFDRAGGKSFRDVYVHGLEQVLQQVAGRVGRFLYVSSTSVYGQDGGEWVDETSPCQPQTPNGSLCLEAEELVRKHFRSAGGLPEKMPAANVLRLAGIYGPGRLIARMEALRAGEPLPGNPEAWLNLIHVDDAVSAILACEQRGQPGETYLVSDNQPNLRFEYYRLFARLIGVAPPAHSVEEASGSLNKRCCNRKLREELQVELKFPTIAEGLPHALSL